MAEATEPTITAAETIIAKALRCIDEIYPSENMLNDTYFPVEQFLDEAVRWVIDEAPVHALVVERVDVSGKKSEWEYANGVAIITVKAEWGRVIDAKPADWSTPAVVIYDTDVRYRQQKNRILKGTQSRPIIVIKKNNTLELYTTDALPTSLIYLYHVPYSAEYIRSQGQDLCAWKLAEIVLLSMSDVQNASVCTTRVNELLQQITL